jgi:tRNA (Thr-GGU) A37 N-methylase
VLFIEDEDILDGSPVVDIKPFIPRFDTQSNARGGWQEKISDVDAQEIGSRRRKEPSG